MFDVSGRARLMAIGALLSACGVEVEEDFSSTSQAVAVNWTNVVGATATANNLTKTAANGWGNSGASSSESIAGDGFVEFTTSEANKGKAVGLSVGDANQDFKDIDFAILPDASGKVLITEAGVTVGTFGTYAANDVFRVENVERTVRYFRNGTLLRTSTRVPQLPLLADAAMFHTGATINNADLSNFNFKNTVGVDILSTNSLRKTVGLTDAWNNSGAISVRTIKADTGFIEFRGGETTHGKAAGLSRVDTNQHFNTIQFGIHLPRLSPNGAAQVFENGVLRFTDTVNWTTTDVFRVEIEINPATGLPRVVYKKNGTTMFTSTQAVSYPVFFDCAFFHDGGTLTDIVVDDTFWTNVVGAEAIGSNLFSNGTSGGAVALTTVPNGSTASVEFQTGETNTAKAVGFNRDNPGQSLAEIDFAILLAQNGHFVVVESGVQRGDFGTYSTTDVFRVQVSGNIVSYQRNGATFFTSTLTPTFPLFIDSALLNTGATIKNTTIAVDAADNVPRDAVSGFAVPVTQADWDAVFAAAGVTSKTVNQSWAMQDTSGDPQPAIGNQLLASTLTNALDYQQSVTGWQRRAISFSPDGNAEFMSQPRTIGPDTTVDSMLMFGYISVDVPTASRRVLVISGGSTGNILLSVNAAGRYRLVSDSVETLGAAAPAGPVRPVMLQLDRTNQVVRVYTDQEIIAAPSFPTTVNNSTRGWGTSNNNGTSGVQRNLLGAQFAGSNAEWTETEMRAVMNVLINGAVPW